MKNVLNPSPSVSERLNQIPLLSVTIMHTHTHISFIAFKLLAEIANLTYLFTYKLQLYCFLWLLHKNKLWYAHGLWDDFFNHFKHRLISISTIRKMELDCSDWYKLTIICPLGWTILCASTIRVLKQRTGNGYYEDNQNGCHNHKYPRRKSWQLLKLIHSYLRNDWG